MIGPSARGPASTVGRAPMRARTGRHLLLLSALALLSGCGDVLDISYGTERAGSLDGAGILLARLEQRTRLKRSVLLNPRLHEGCDLIVHLAPDAALPAREACTWLQDWLEDEEGRQAVLILRGDSPAPVLCRRWAAEARAEGGRVGGAAGARLLDLAGRFERTALRADPPAMAAGGATAATLSCPLFRLRPAPGEPALSATLGLGEALPAPLTLRAGPVIEAEHARPLVMASLAGGAEVPWSVAIPVGGSRLVVAVNASPLLDGAMPDVRARRLMAAWLDEITGWHHGDGPPACAWIAALRVRDGEPEASNPMAMAFGRWPLALAAWHLVALVALWLAYRAWWLGRCETPRDGRMASFGSHVDALAGHLAAGGHHQAAARAIADASGLPAPPSLPDADAARAWLADASREKTEDHR